MAAAISELTTERLRLRRWRAGDREPFARMNADARVMEFFPSPLSRSESDEMIEKIEAGFRADGFGAWAVEIAEGNEFAGFVGLSPVTFEAPFTPAVEIAWRLAFEHWGQGYASEAAREVLKAAFDQIGLHEVVSFTSSINQRSRRVMEGLGMTREATDDFDHPSLAPGHPLRPHVLYRINRDR